jgi:hypothetical protein
MGYFYGSGVALKRHEQDIIVGRGYGGNNSWKLEWLTRKFSIHADF